MDDGIGVREDVMALAKVGEVGQYALGIGAAAVDHVRVEDVMAALWSGDVVEARTIADRLDAAVSRGQAVALDQATLRAGIAALDDRRGDAVAGYRDVLRGWRQLGCAFDEAIATIDMAILMAPTEQEMPDAPAAIDAARETLARLGARPLLARLDAGQPVGAGPPVNEASGALQPPVGDGRLLSPDRASTARS